MLNALDAIHFMLRFLTAGESHGKGELAILEGMPAGLSLSQLDIQNELEKRRFGRGRGGRGKIEKDQVVILSGVRHGLTLGSPIALYIENSDFNNWDEIMSIEPLKPLRVKLIHPRGDVDSHIGKITNPRPGHADFAGMVKYRFTDIRNVLERASARETVMRVAVGAVCKKFLGEFKLQIASHTLRIGGVSLQDKQANFKSVSAVFKSDPEIRCTDPQVSLKMKEAILNATRNRETLGGIIEVIAHHVPIGLGSYVHFDRKLDGRIALALMSIPSVKAVEIGNGIINSSLTGSKVHDEIFFKNNFFRKTNRAGGIEGGVTNGEDIICRIYLKPLSTLNNPLNSVDLQTKKAQKAHIERSDICVVPRAGVIAESMLAFTIADAFLEKFGCDTMTEISENFKNCTKDL